MDIATFLTKQSREVANTAASPHCTNITSSGIPEEVIKAVKRGLHIFPEPEIAKLSAQPEMFIDDASNDLSCLQELATIYPKCFWRVAVGASRLCVLRSFGSEGRASLGRLTEDLEDCTTLSAHRGDTFWAIYWRPKGLFLGSSIKLAPGVSILADHGSLSLPMAYGTTWLNPMAEIEAVPYWLRKLVL